MWTLKFPIDALKLMQIYNKLTIIENFYASRDYERNNKNIFTKIEKVWGRVAILFDKFIIFEKKK